MEGLSVENKRRSTIQNDNASDNPYQGTDFPPEGSSGGDADTVNYDAKKMVGHGSFGAVFLANVVETGEVVAIKKVLQDRRFKNRELKIMRELVKLPHPYIVPLRHYFMSKGSKSDDVSEYYQFRPLIYSSLPGFISSHIHRCILIWSWSTYQKHYIQWRNIITKIGHLSPSYLSNCICISCHEHWRTSTVWVYVIVISNHKIFWWTKISKY